MEMSEAWPIIQRALDIGTQAAHGAGLIDRHQVGQINLAEKTVADYINAQDKANAEFVQFFNEQAEAAANVKPALVKDDEPAEEPCGCDEKQKVEA